MQLPASPAVSVAAADRAAAAQLTTRRMAQHQRLQADRYPGRSAAHANTGISDQTMNGRTFTHSY